MMNNKLRLFILYSIALILSIPGIRQSFAADYQQVAGLMDLRTTFSDGAYDVDQLAQLAKERGFSVLFINDHDRMAMEYGIPPFRNILKKREELNSINKQGAENFLRAIEDAAKKHPDMIIIPGSETTPFYYWTGSFLAGNLTAHNHEKRLLTVGLEKPEDYETLPILHNNAFPNLHTKAIPGILLFSGAALAAIFMIRWKGLYRIFGVIVLIVSAAFIINTDPFRTSPFDPYHGDQGMAPYQMAIDYVHSRGGMTFWNYPETKSGVRKLGPIRVSTLPYPAAIQQAKSYTGFAALYGDNITLTEPGNIWDTTLKEYCMGYRDRPAWGIATADFHSEGKGEEKLGNFQTVFLVQEKSKDAVLKALRNGKMYACQVNYLQPLKLDEFSISSRDGRAKGISGDEIVMSGFPTIKISLSAKEPSAKTVTVRLIRAGELINVFEEKLPLQIEYVDPFYKPGEKTYYRMDMKGQGIIVSNPIFVSFK
jgi:hypothetical protein